MLYLHYKQTNKTQKNDTNRRPSIEKFRKRQATLLK